MFSREKFDDRLEAVLHTRTDRAIDIHRHRVG